VIISTTTAKAEPAAGRGLAASLLLVATVALPRLIKDGGGSSTTRLSAVQAGAAKAARQTCVVRRVAAHGVVRLQAEAAAMARGPVAAVAVAVATRVVAAVVGMLPVHMRPANCLLDRKLVSAYPQAARALRQAAAWVAAAPMAESLSSGIEITIYCPPLCRSVARKRSIATHILSAEGRRRVVARENRVTFSRVHTIP
jgi:hypothetical protein